MQIVTFLVLLLIIIGVKHKTFLNPRLLFAIVWMGIIFISGLQLFGLYAPSQYAYLIILIGTVSFMLGTFINVPKLKLSIEQFKKKSLTKCSYSINYKILYLFLVLAILAILPETVISIGYLLSGYKLGDIHRIYTTEYVDYYTNGTSTWLYYVFVYPTTLSSSILAAYDFWLGKRDKLLQILVIALIIMRALQYGGRGPIFYLMFFYSIGFLLSRKYSKQVKERKKKMKRKTKILGLLVIVGIGYVCYQTLVSRLIGGLADVFRTFVEYFGSCITVMDLNIQRSQEYSFTFGSLSLAGFIKFFNMLIYGGLKILGINYSGIIMPHIDAVLTELEQPVFTGLGQTNSFVTPFYYFYKDGWLFAVILFSIFWGMFSQHSFKQCYEKVNVKDAYFLFFYLFTILFSMTRCWLGSVEGALVFLSYFVFIKRSPVIDEIENKVQCNS